MKNDPGVLIPCAAHVPPRCRGKTKNVCESHAGFRAGKTHCIRNPKPKLLPEQPKTLPKWTQNRPQMDPEGLLETILEPCSKKNLILKAPKWPLELQKWAKIETKSEKKRKKTNTKNIAFPGMFFSRLSVISEPFLEWIREPLNLRKWAYGVGKTLIFTFWAFPNPPRKRTCQKVQKNANLNWIWEHFPSKNVTKHLQKRLRNFDREKVEKIEKVEKTLATFDLSAKVGSPP